MTGACYTSRGNVVLHQKRKRKDFIHTPSIYAVKLAFLRKSPIVPELGFESIAQIGN